MVSIIPDLPPPTPDAHARASSLAFPVAFCPTAIRQGTPAPYKYSLLTVCPGPFGAVINISISFLGSINLK